jgi:hypothetical protein
LKYERPDFRSSADVHSSDSSDVDPLMGDFITDMREFKV